MDKDNLKAFPFLTHYSKAVFIKMEEYQKFSILLCIYGIFKEFRPSEPYLVPLMTQPPLNFTSQEVTQDIFPVSTYSSLVLLVVVFLVTDLLRYKAVIIVQAVCAVITYTLLIYGRGLFEMQIMQVVYGLYLAAEVAYFTYIYAKVDKEHFQKVTSYTRSAYLVGKSLSGIMSQVAVYFNIASFEQLLWITVGSEVLALIWAVLLPSVDRSLYFHRQSPGRDGQTNDNDKAEVKYTCGQVLMFMFNDLKTAFTNLYVLKWALWWALATCGYYMVTSNVQVLWKDVMTESHSTAVEWNGIVETTYTLLGAIASLMVGKVNLDWKKLGEPFLAVGSLVAGGLLLCMSLTHHITIAYVTYILFTISYQTMITVANSQVAEQVNRDSYGLIFGITTFAVYIFLSVFTFIVLQVYRLNIRPQFQTYAVYYGVLGIVFVTSMIVNYWKSWISQ